MTEVIQAQHECKWANQHEAVSIISVEGHKFPWTLRVDTFKLGMFIPEEEALEFNIDIEYCPFCGQKL